MERYNVRFMRTAVIGAILATVACVALYVSVSRDTGDKTARFCQPDTSQTGWWCSKSPIEWKPNPVESHS